MGVNKIYKLNKKHLFLNNKIENENRECVKQTIIRPKN